jgi:hypothetical protein
MFVCTMSCYETELGELFRAGHPDRILHQNGGDPYSNVTGDEAMVRVQPGELLDLSE